MTRTGAPGRLDRPRGPFAPVSCRSARCVHGLGSWQPASRQRGLPAQAHPRPNRRASVPRIRPPRWGGHTQQRGQPVPGAALRPASTSQGPATQPLRHALSAVGHAPAPTARRPRGADPPVRLASDAPASPGIHSTRIRSHTLMGSALPSAVVRSAEPRACRRSPRGLVHVGAVSGRPQPPDWAALQRELRALSTFSPPPYPAHRQAHRQAHHRAHGQAHGRSAGHWC